MFSSRKAAAMFMAGVMAVCSLHTGVIPAEETADIQTESISQESTEIIPEVQEETSTPVQEQEPVPAQDEAEEVNEAPQADTAPQEPVSVQEPAQEPVETADSAPEAKQEEEASVPDADVNGMQADADDPSPQETGTVEAENREQGLSVLFTADNAGFPEGVYGEVSLIEGNDLEEKRASLGEYLGGNGLEMEEPVLAVDIGLYCEDGSKYVPSGDTTVRLYAGPEDPDGEQLFHLKEDGTWEKLSYLVHEETENGAACIEFSTGSFSPFLLGRVSGSEPMMLLKAENGTGSLRIKRSTQYTDNLGNKCEWDYPEFSSPVRFKIALSKNDEPVSGTFSSEGTMNSIVFENGVAVTGLKVGELIQINGIPDGCEYTVTPGDADEAEIYEARFKNSGLITEGNVSEEVIDINMIAEHYFYYKDTTGKVPSHRYYFRGRVESENGLTWGEVPFSCGELEDGTKIYYYDKNSSNTSIVVESGTKVICANTPVEACQLIGSKYKPVDNVRVGYLWQGRQEWTDGTHTELKCETSWSGYGKERGIVAVAAELYGLETISKVAKDNIKADAVFCLANGSGEEKKKFSLTHYDTYEYANKTYKNVYMVNNELKDFDSEDEDTFIHTENSEAAILYPRSVSSTLGWNPVMSDPQYGRQDWYFLYETDCDDGHFMGKDRNGYWNFSGIEGSISLIDQFNSAVFYNNEPCKAWWTENSNYTYMGRPDEFDYGKLELRDSTDKALVNNIHVENGVWPGVSKKAVCYGIHYDIDRDKEYVFDICDKNGNVLHTFSLKDGETFQLSPQNLPGLTEDTLWNDDCYIKERLDKGWCNNGGGYNVTRDNYDGTGYRYHLAFPNTNSIQTLNIYNERQAATLKIKKSVVGNKDADCTSRFKVTLWDEYADGSRHPIRNLTFTADGTQYATDENGELEFDINTTGEETEKTFSFGVPAGCHYKIEEVYCSLEGAEPVSKTNDKGVIETASTVTSEWVNGITHNLSIRKIYDDAGTNAVFEKAPGADDIYYGIRVHLEDVPEAMRYLVSVDGYFSPNNDGYFRFQDRMTGSVGGCFGRDGTADFNVWVKAGESIAVKNLPDGASYSLQEKSMTGTYTDTDKLFDISYTGQSGTIDGGDAEAVVTNTLKTFDLKLSKEIYGYDNGVVSYFVYRASTDYYKSFDLEFTDRNGITRRFFTDDTTNYVLGLIPFRPEDGEIVIKIPVMTHWYVDEYVPDLGAEVPDYEDLVEYMAENYGHLPGMFSLGSSMVNHAGYHMTDYAATSGSNRSEDMILPYVNASRMVMFEKVDENGAPVSGAHMQILFKPNENYERVLCDWVTTDEPYILKLNTVASESSDSSFFILPGTGTDILSHYPTYSLVLREEEAPEGYAKMEDIPFKINAVGRTFNMYLNGFESNPITRRDHYAEIELEDGTKTFTLRATDEHERHDVVISKQDINGDEIAGAQMKITGRETGASADITPITWTSGSDGHVDEEDDTSALKPHTVSLEPGTYTLHEESAPEGYLIASDIGFTVETDGSVKVDGRTADKITMTDNPDTVPVTVYKSVTPSYRNITSTFRLTLWDEEDEEKVPRSGVTVYRYAGRQQPFATTDENGQITFELHTTPNNGDGIQMYIPYDSHYSVEETGCSEENCVFAYVYDANIGNYLTVPVVERDRPERNKYITFYNCEKSPVPVRKIDGKGDFLPGAVLQILDDKGSVVKEWTTGEDTETVNLLPNINDSLLPKYYVLHEKEAPEGYIHANDIRFNVYPAGLNNARIIPYGGTEVDALEMTDHRKHDLTIRKTWEESDATFEPANKKVAIEYLIRDIPEGCTGGFDTNSSLVNESGAGEFYNTFFGSSDFNSAVRKTHIGSGYYLISHTDDNGKRTYRLHGTVWLDEDEEFVICGLPEGASYEVREKGHMAGTGSCYPDPEAYFNISYENREGVLENDMTATITNSLRFITVTMSKEVFGYYDGTPFFVEASFDPGMDFAEGKDILTWETADGLSGTFEKVSPTSGYYKAAFPLLPGKPVTLVIPPDSNWSIYEYIPKDPYDGRPVAELYELLMGSNRFTYFTSYTGYGYSALNYGIGTSGNRLGTRGSGIEGLDADEIDCVFRNASSLLPIEKVDGHGNFVPGAKMAVIDKESGTVLHEWTTENRIHLWNYNNNGVINNHGTSLAGRTLILRETEVPDGYVKADDIEFTVKRKAYESGFYYYVLSKDDEEADRLTMTDLPAEYDVVVSKQDVNGDEIAGAQLKITGRETGASADITPITWTSGSDSHVNSEDDTSPLKPHTVRLKPGTYTLHEEAVPDSSVYITASDITFTVDTEGNVKVADEDVDRIVMVDNYKPHDVVISKQDVNGDEIGGAQLKISGRETDAETDITPITWTSVEGENKTVQLKPGIYTLHEEAVPDSNVYVPASDITFTVDAEGNVKVAGEDVDKVVMVDDYKPHDVVVSKQDINGNEIEGASLKITGRETGASADITPITWTSGSDGHVDEQDETSALKPHTVSLKPGTYTLHEEAVPDSSVYVVASDITFTVDSEGNIKVADEDADRIVMVDDYKPHDVVISKQDIAGEEIAGASLKITGRETGASADITPVTWTSGSDGHVDEQDETSPLKPHTVSLKAGDYVLHEETAPDGYAVTTDIAFTVNTDGSVSVNGGTADRVVMTDRAITFKVNKYDLAGSRELDGAVIELYRSSDVNNGVPVSGKTPLDTWTSATGENHDFGPKLKAGGSYFLIETTAPTGYEKTTAIPFSVADDGTITCDLQKDGSGSYMVCDELIRHSLTVSKTVKGNMGDRAKQFSFTLSLEKGTVSDLPASVPFTKNGADGTALLTDGKYTFTLGNGDTIVFREIPYGTSYTITEDRTGIGDYTVSSVNESGVITTDDVSCSFTNTRNMLIATGVRNSRILIYIGILLLGMIALLKGFRRRRRIL